MIESVRLDINKDEVLELIQQALLLRGYHVRETPELWTKVKVPSWPADGIIEAELAGVRAHGTKLPTAEQGERDYIVEYHEEGRVISQQRIAAFSYMDAMCRAYMAGGKWDIGPNRHVVVKEAT